MHLIQREWNRLVLVQVFISEISVTETITEIIDPTLTETETETVLFVETEII